MMGLVDLALTQERLVKIAVTDTSCFLVAEVANLQLGDMLWVQDAPCQYEIKGRPVVSHGIQCGGHGQGHGEAAAENEPLWGSMMNVWSAIELWHWKAGVSLPLAQRTLLNQTFKAGCMVRRAPSRRFS